MRQMMLKLWKDDGGALLAIEFILFVVILLFGLIVGIVGVRNAVVAELSGVADAVADLAPCFSFAGISNCEASVCGSQVIPGAANTINTAKLAASQVETVVVNPCQ